MKKAVSILLIIALLFSFAACGKKVNGENLTTTETTVPPPVIEKQSHSKKFKNDDGKTVFTVDVEVPQITGNCDESVMKYINTLSLEMFDDACDFAESNLQNAEKFMASSGSDSPWSKKITVETTYADSRFVCFLMKEYFSIGGDAGEPVWSSRCFDIKREQVCTLFDFTPGNYKIFFRFCTAGKGNAFIKRCADRHMKHRGFLYFTGHRQIFICKRLSLSRIADAKHRRHIGYDTSHIQRNTGWRNRPSSHFIDHRLLIARWIKAVHFCQSYL